MNMKLFSAAVLLLAASNALSFEVDQFQTTVDATRNALHYGPVGQSFVPQTQVLNQVSLKMLDPGEGENGAIVHLVVREGGPNGSVTGYSDSVYLEDCFNFDQDPGCGQGGGWPAQVDFTFSDPVSVEPGNDYFFEVAIEPGSDSVNVGYSYNNEYLHGAMYSAGAFSQSDLWFKTYSNFANDDPTNDTALLVSTGNQLKTYALDGTLLSVEPIPEVLSGGPARGIAGDTENRVHVFNGTFSPELATYANSSWSSHSYSGWSIASNGSYGAVASLGDHVFVTDQSTAHEGAPSGLVRFDSANGYSAQRFLQGTDYIDVTVGLNGNLYALRNSYGALDIIDPMSMTIINSLHLGYTSSSRAVAADGDGNIYMASWDGKLHKYDSSAMLLTSVDVGSDFSDINLYDIDIDASGTIAVSNRYGNIYLTNTDLTSVERFSVSSDGAFVAFSSYSGEASDPSPEPEYCDSAGQHSYYEWIESVALNGTENITGNDQGYLDATDMELPLTRSGINSLTLQPGFQFGSYLESWKVWIDFNGNGIFEADEVVLEASSRSNVSGYFQVPATALTGQTRMRVSMQYHTAPLPCGTFYYGEVEDYLVEIPQE